MTKMMPFEDLLNLIDQDPIIGAREAQKRNKGVRIMNYQSSVSAGALYRRLKGSKTLTSAFYQLPFYSTNEYTNYAKNTKYLNKHCHQFVYGSREGREGKRAEDHASATQSYLDDDTKTLDDILEALKNGGFAGLKKAKSAKEIRARLKETEAPERKHGSASGDAKSSVGGSGSSLIKASANTAGGPPKPVLPKIAMEKVFEHLLVAMEQEELARFLAGKSEVGDRFGILVEREANDVNGLLVWRAVEIAKASDEA